MATVSGLEFFPRDYASARAAFIAAAQARAARLQAYPLAARGPADLALSIDTAYLGPRRPRRLLVVCSGTHGAEGFAGSALQQQWLAQRALATPPANSGCLFVHALNPYGFAWLRRTNEHNVDLNRNGLESFPGPANPAYRVLRFWLNPPTRPRWPDLFWLQAVRLLSTHGWQALRQAIVGGQYEFPDGLFYGGARREESTAHFARILADETLAQAEDIIALDIHTGLGRFANARLMVDYAEESPAFQELARWFGRAILASSQPRGSAVYRVKGGLMEFLERRLPQARVRAGVLEIGTIPLAPLLARLRRENRAHHHAPDSELLQHARAALRDAFCPRARIWRRRVLAQGESIFVSALRALAED